MGAEPESRVRTSNAPSRVERQSVTVALVFKRKKRNDPGNCTGCLVAGGATWRPHGLVSALSAFRGGRRERRRRTLASSIF